MHSIDAMAREITQWIEEFLGAEPEHLWMKYPDYAVFRHELREPGKGPWFALIANVDYSQIGISDKQGEVFIAVVKADPNVIDELITRPGYARGYHMNKQHWLTVLLDGTVPMEAVQERIEDSFDLTAA